MRKIFLLIILFIISVNCYADAGYGYRFHVKTILENTETIEGYIYVYSWDKYEEMGNAKEFILKNSPNKKLNIYKYITTVANNSINIDFALADSSLTINLNEITDIRRNDYLSFGGGVVRLIELPKSQFNLIKIGNPFSYGVNAYDLTEYCHLLFLNWNEPVTKELANQVYTKLEIKKKELGNLEGNNGILFFNYFNELKENLIDKNIILIMDCESC